MEKQRVLESSIQSDIIKALKLDNWFVIRLRGVSPSGSPDLLIIKNGVGRLVEVKRPKGKLSALQLRVHNELKSHGVSVHVVYSVKDLFIQLKTTK